MRLKLVVIVLVFVIIDGVDAAAATAAAVVIVAAGGVLALNLTPPQQKDETVEPGRTFHEHGRPSVHLVAEWAGFVKPEGLGRRGNILIRLIIAADAHGRNHVLRSSQATLLSLDPGAST